MWTNMRGLWGPHLSVGTHESRGYREHAGRDLREITQRVFWNTTVLFRWRYGHILTPGSPSDTTDTRNK